MHLPGSEEMSSMSSNTAAQEPDFSEFMWMAEEDLESFDHEVLQEVQQRIQRHLMRDPSEPRGEEEVFLQQMLEEEEARDTVFFPQHGGQHRNLAALQNQFQRLQMSQQMQQQQQQRHLPNGGQYNTVVHREVSQQTSMGQLMQQQTSSDFQLNPEAAVFVPRDDGDEGGERNKQQTVATGGGSTEATNNSAPPRST